VVLIAVIDSFSIEVKESGDRKYIIDASPLGVIRNDVFSRGGDSIAIPPKKVEPAKISEIEKIYAYGLADKENFSFSKLSHNEGVRVPVDGDKFFNKHI